MKKSILLIICSIIYISIFAQSNTLEQSNYAADTLIYHIPQKDPLRAITIGFGVNMGIWTFNRYITHEDFAYISLHTIKRNLKTYPVWDSDKLSTNLIGHPYHGSLYYNAARANGYSFWGSLPFTLGGSLM